MLIGVVNLKIDFLYDTMIFGGKMSQKAQRYTFGNFRKRIQFNQSKGIITTKPFTCENHEPIYDYEPDDLPPYKQVEDQE